MAPRRKHAIAPPSGREFKLRIPEDVASRIEAKAKTEGRPQNRVIINELAATPYLERAGDLAALIEDMKITLARQGARIVWHDLSDELLNAVDAALEAQGSALLAAMDKIRVIRAGMLIHTEGKRKK